MANLHLHKGAHSFSSWERGCSSQELAGKLFQLFRYYSWKLVVLGKNHQLYFRKGCELWRRLDRNIRWLEPVSIFTKTSFYLIIYLPASYFHIKRPQIRISSLLLFMFLPHWISQQHYHHHNRIVIFQPSLRIANQRHNNWNCRRDKFTAVCPNNVPEAANVSLVRIKLVLFCSIQNIARIVC